MQNHNDDTIKTSDTGSSEIYTSHFIERVECERELGTEQNCNLLTPTLMAITAFLSRSPICSTGGLVAHSAGCWFSLPHFTPTDWTSCALSYIIIRRLPSSCGRHKSHSFKPFTVKVIFWYSSTRCTCYLHRCISYFDSPVGLEVNIQHKLNIHLD